MTSRYLFAKAALALVLAAISLQAYQATPAAEKPKDASTPQAEQKASIEGKVVDALLGKPIKDATLLLVRSTGVGTPATVKAEEDGHFKFKDLDAGSYVLIGDHPRYARQAYGSRNGLLGGTPLTIATGQQMKELSFALSPSAVASGRVLDEEGEPLPKVMVAALKGMYSRGKRQFLPLGTATTNDLGEYRLANLAAGRYTIMAFQLGMGPAAAAKPAEGDSTYVPTYYPNGIDAASAAPVEITAGRDVGGLDVRMAKAKAVRVAGQVSGGTKDQKITVRIMPKGAGFMSMLTGQNAPVKMPEGTFEFKSIVPGSYTIRASDPSGMKPLGIGVPLEVGKRAIENLTVDVTPSGDLSGTLLMAGDVKAPLNSVKVMLEQVDGFTMVPPNVTAAEDGTFIFKDLPADKYLVRVLNAPANAYVEHARLGTQEIPDEGMALGGVNPGKIEVKLNPGGASVDGVVNGKDDNPMSGITVALIPSSHRYMLYQSALTDQRGAFSFKGITPGEYKVIAFEDIEPNAFQDPEYVKPYERKGESLSLKENERKAVTLKAAPRE